MTTQDRIDELLRRLHSVTEGDVSLEQTRVKGGLLRIVRTEPDQGHGYDRRACSGWIDPRTGDILYSGSWARPGNMRPRGNVNDDDYGISAFGKWGVLSLEERRLRDERGGAA
jgi:hypothetical protein